MRRLILVFFMVLLPLQWSWAAAARGCQHEEGGSHFGHHQHEHAADEGPENSGEDRGAFPTSATGEHPDCQSCHGLGIVCMAAPPQGGLLSLQDAPPGEGGKSCATPPVYGLLRPPQAA